MEKLLTSRISIFEPDETQLVKELIGREVSPGLMSFLKGVLKTKKWTRKINIPSGHDDAAAVLVFTAAMKEGGLEIFSELYVYLCGQTLIEKWQVCGEGRELAGLPKEALNAVEINKVSVDGQQVTIEFQAPMPGGYSEVIVREFDFSVERPRLTIVPNPLLSAKSLGTAGAV